MARRFCCNCCGLEFDEPEGVYEKLRCPECAAIADDGTIECIEGDCPLDVNSAIFEAAQALCPYQLVQTPKTTAYLISVIANAMKGLNLVVCEDVLSRNKAISDAMEYAMKYIDVEEAMPIIDTTPRSDDDLLCEAGDEIDNAVFDAIQALSPEKLEWDMRYIGNVTEAIESAMESFNVPTCHPWQDDDEHICYSLENERCQHCPRACGKEKFY